MRMRRDPGGFCQGPEGAAGLVGSQRRAPLGAQHQVQLDGPGRLAGLDVQQGQPRAVAIGGAGAWLLELLVLVVTECRHREGGQAQHGMAGGRLQGADHQQLAPPAALAGLAGGQLLVDAGQRLAEPDGPRVQVQVTPFQAAQLPGAGAGGRRQDGEGPSQGRSRWAAASRWATCSGVSELTEWLGRAGGSASSAGRWCHLLA
jgi:hypothetical protein